MYDGSYYQLMAEYNCWMNRNIYSVCSAIPDEQRKQDMGAFFKSIHGTLNHLLYGDKAWMGRFTFHPFSITVKETLIYIRHYLLLYSPGRITSICRVGCAWSLTAIIWASNHLLRKSWYISISLRPKGSNRFHWWQVCILDVGRSQFRQKKVRGLL